MSTIPEQDDIIQDTLKQQALLVNTLQKVNPWWKRLSKWARAVGVVTRMLSRSSTSTRLELIEKAETYLYRMIQVESFPAKISSLQDNKKVLPTSKLFKFSPFLDEKGVMHVRGRLHNARWEFGRQHAIILAKHYLTELLISKFHIQRKHQGVEALLEFIYQKFWMIGGRRLVRRIKQQCVQCRRYDAQPCAEVTAPLPEG